MSVAVPAVSSNADVYGSSSSIVVETTADFDERRDVATLSGSPLAEGPLDTLHSGMDADGPPDDLFEVTGRYDGFISAIYDDGAFQVELRRSGEAEETKILTEFDNSEVIEPERSLLRVGAPVFVTVGRLRSPSGRVRSTWSLHLRRVAAWSGHEIAHAIELGRKRARQVRGD